MLLLWEGEPSGEHQEESALYLLRVEDYLQGADDHDKGPGAMIEAVVTLHDDIDDLEHLFATETFAHARAEYTVKRVDDAIIITISAEDATALRATITSITRVLAVYERAKQV